MPSALLVVNLGDPVRITHSATGQTLVVDGGQVLAESPAALEGI